MSEASLARDLMRVDAQCSFEYASLLFRAHAVRELMFVTDPNVGTEPGIIQVQAISGPDGGEAASMSDTSYAAQRVLAGTR